MYWESKEGLLETYTKKIWIFETIFWKMLNYLVFDQDIERKKHILENVYWFEDIENVFWKKFEKRELHRLNEAINKIYKKEEEKNN